MFEGKTLWQIINMGGFTMYVLLACSVLSIGVIIERLIYYAKKSRLDKIKFMDRIRQEIKDRNLDNAVKICNEKPVSISAVVNAGLKYFNSDPKEVSSSMEREIMIETVKLEQYTTIVGTIGNIAVYIGLFGTVIGIIRSFHDISRVGAGGISIVIAGVAEALICTATGLCVAVPAVVAYNYFTKRVDKFVTDMEYCASETEDLLNIFKKTEGSI